MNPNHLCVWRRDISVDDKGEFKEQFPHQKVSEDHRWGEAMTKHYTSIHNIDMVLYFYNYSKEHSETH